MNIEAKRGANSCVFSSTIFDVQAAQENVWNSTLLYFLFVTYLHILRENADPQAAERTSGKQAAPAASAAASTKPVAPLPTPQAAAARTSSKQAAAAAAASTSAAASTKYVAASPALQEAARTSSKQAAASAAADSASAAPANRDPFKKPAPKAPRGDADGRSASPPLSKSEIKMVRDFPLAVIYFLLFPAHYFL